MAARQLDICDQRRCASFEALVARIVADVRPDVDRGWIAEVDGARAGCVVCCHVDDRTAKLRILLVEPWARGRGIGRRLVDTCVAHARGAGYQRIELWTSDVLTSARRSTRPRGSTGPRRAVPLVRP